MTAQNMMEQVLSNYKVLLVYALDRDVISDSAIHIKANSVCVESYFFQFTIMLADRRNPERYFGWFWCSECENTWTSAWIWEGWGQKCNECVGDWGWDEVDYTYPYRYRPRLTREQLIRLYEEEGREWDRDRPRRTSDHDYENCEYCADLCGSIHIMPTQHACKRRTRRVY